MTDIVGVTSQSGLLQNSSLPGQLMLAHRLLAPCNVALSLTAQSLLPANVSRACSLPAQTEPAQLPRVTSVQSRPCLEDSCSSLQAFVPRGALSRGKISKTNGRRGVRGAPVGWVGGWSVKERRVRKAHRLKGPQRWISCVNVHPNWRGWLMRFRAGRIADAHTFVIQWSCAPQSFGAQHFETKLCLLINFEVEGNMSFAYFCFQSKLRRSCSLGFGG